MSTIIVDKIAKSFGATKAVQDVSFEVRPGEIFGLLGPNGSGKTTSIRVILDIYQPDSGSVSILGGAMTNENLTISVTSQKNEVSTRMCRLIAA